MPSLIERQVLRARNGLAYIAGTNRPAIAQTPKDTVWRRDKAELWRYRREDAPVSVKQPILICHSLVSKSYVLDLQPNNSMIRYLLGEGFDVFLLDWGVADAVEAQNTLEDYVDDYIPEAIEATLMESGADELNLIGYCFGGVLTLLLMAGHQDELPIRNLVTLATPADYSKMGFMSQMFASGRLDPDYVIDETGLVSSSRID